MQTNAAIAISWGTGAGKLENSSGTALHGNSTASGYTLGGFVQLIWTGSDGLISPFDPTSNTGINGTADDRVVATGWIGEGYVIPGDGGLRDGTMAVNSSVSLGTTLGSTFYVRFFDTVSPNYASGYVPASGKYNNISDANWTIAQGNIDSGTASFSIGSNQLATVNIVPEPTSITLLGIGLAVVVMRRRFAK